MKNQNRNLVMVCIVILFSLSCSLAGVVGRAVTGGGENQAAPGAGQAQSATAAPAGDEKLYFLALPVEVKDATGELKAAAARALKTVQGMKIIVVLENTSTDPLHIYENVDWQVKAFDAGGNVIGKQDPLNNEIGLPPGQKAVLTAWMTKWEGDAARFELEILAGKVRFIQEDMQDKFRALQLPVPLFPVEAQPYTLTDETFLGRKVVRTKAEAVVRNPNPGPAKEVFVTGVYYDAAGLIIGCTGYPFVDVPAGGQAPISLDGLQFFAGEPARAEYYAYIDPYYIEDVFGIW